MDQDKALEVCREYITQGKIKFFSEIFQYVQKTTMHKLTGINYYKMLRLAKNPKKMNFEDVYAVAHVLTLPPPTISTLIHNQIDGQKATSKK